MHKQANMGKVKIKLIPQAKLSNYSKRFKLKEIIYAKLLYIIRTVNDPHQP